MTRAGLALLSILAIPSGRTRAQDATQAPPAPVSKLCVSSTVGGTTYVSPVFEWPRSIDPRGEVSGPFVEFLTSKYSYPANTRVYCYVFFNSTDEATTYWNQRISCPKATSNG